jgi:hemoglobin
MGRPEPVGAIIARYAPTILGKGPAMTQPTVDQHTPYQRIGGATTVRRVVDRLYAWILRDDNLYLPYFEHLDMVPLRAHMVKLLSQVLGGPHEYTGRDLAVAHARLNITAEHYGRVGDYLIAALLVEHTPPDIIAAVQDVLAAQQPNIVAPRPT